MCRVWRYLPRQLPPPSSNFSSSSRQLLIRQQALISRISLARLPSVTGLEFPAPQPGPRCRVSSYSQGPSAHPAGRTERLSDPGHGHSGPSGGRCSSADAGHMLGSENPGMKATHALSLEREVLQSEARVPSVAPPAWLSTHLCTPPLRPSPASLSPTPAATDTRACVGRTVKEGSGKQTWTEFICMERVRLRALLP